MLVAVVACAARPHLRHAHRASHHRGQRSGWTARETSGLVVDPGLSEISRLEPVVVREVQVSPAPGAAPLGASLEPGFELPATNGSWLHVHVDDEVVLDGWVPASACGLFYVETRRQRGTFELDDTTVVRSAPDARAPIVATLAGGVVVSLGVAAGDWTRLETVVDDVRVVGWALRSVERPTGRLRTFDFSDDVIEGDLVTPEGPRD